MVYLITSPEEGLCKIGYSKDPESRLSDLQKTSKFPLVLSGCFFGNMDYEKDLHEKFKSLRIKGEWFKIDSGIDSLFLNSLVETIVFEETGGGFYKIKNTNYFVSKALFLKLNLQYVDSLTVITLGKLLLTSLIDEIAICVSGYKNKIFQCSYAML